MTLNMYYRYHMYTNNSSYLYKQKKTKKYLLTIAILLMELMNIFSCPQKFAIFELKPRLLSAASLPEFNCDLETQNAKKLQDKAIEKKNISLQIKYLSKCVPSSQSNNEVHKPNFYDSIYINSDNEQIKNCIQESITEILKLKNSNVKKLLKLIADVSIAHFKDIVANLVTQPCKSDDSIFSSADSNIKTIENAIACRLVVPPSIAILHNEQLNTENWQNSTKHVVPESFLTVRKQILTGDIETKRVCNLGYTH